MTKYRIIVKGNDSFSITVVIEAVNFNDAIDKTRAMILNVFSPLTIEKLRISSISEA